MESSDKRNGGAGGRTMVAGLFADRGSADQAAGLLRTAGLADYELEEAPGGEWLLTVVTGSRTDEALDILEDCGGDTGAARREQRATTAPEQVPTSEPPVRQEQGQRVRIPLHGEVLNIRKELIQTGEVRVRKEIITEMRTIQVPVRREELVIEQRRPGSNGAAEMEEVLRVPLMEEKIIVDKQPAVIEEVFIEKRLVERSQQVRETLRREQLNIRLGESGGAGHGQSA